MGDATYGVPAHLTMLFPFVEPERLDRSVRRTIAEVAATIEPFEYRLARPARWPDTVYLSVEPVETFVRLQSALQAAFPSFPIYGGAPGFVFVPHVTIAEGAAVDDPATLTDPGWANLPLPSRATGLDVIAGPPGERWRTVWRVPLGRSGADTRG